MKKAIIVTITIIGILISGCASKGSAITPEYISSSAYSDLDCDQINAELRQLNDRISSLKGKQDEIYQKDQMLGWAGAFLIWPAWFFIKGDGQVASDLANAMGKQDAFEELKIQKKCGM